ncbi:unnamed protein product [Closterium sp. NIES-65]|nr:unnamed protein product [Closterium sp. NIES-65]
MHTGVDILSGGDPFFDGAFLREIFLGIDFFSDGWRGLRDTLHYPGLPRDVCATVLTTGLVVAWLRLFDLLARRNLVERKLSRKVLHITIGLFFVFVCWPLFRYDHSSGTTALQVRPPLRYDHSSGAISPQRVSAGAVFCGGGPRDDGGAALAAGAGRHAQRRDRKVHEPQRQQEVREGETSGKGTRGKNAVGPGFTRNDRIGKSMSRSGSKSELLSGPLCYAVTIMLMTVVYWRTSPVGMLALVIMCGGDGVADIVGRRCGSWKLPWNEQKSWAGSAAMLLCGFALSLM